MIAAEREVRRNRVLAALPAPARARWLPHLEPIALSLDEVLHEADAKVSHAYFPTTAVVSLLHELTTGVSAQFASVGHDGMVGITLFMGGETTPSRAVVQHAGKAYRIASEIISDEFRRPDVSEPMLRYSQALVTQIAQTAVCNRHHSIDQQLCRWLLVMLDGVEGPQISMTHESVANMLGVRRESVTQSAQRLQSTELIKYARGHVTVLDRVGLEHRVCECYAVVKRETDRLLAAPARSFATAGENRWSHARDDGHARPDGPIGQRAIRPMALVVRPARPLASKVQDAPRASPREEEEAGEKIDKAASSNRAVAGATCG